MTSMFINSTGWVDGGGGIEGRFSVRDVQQYYRFAGSDCKTASAFLPAVKM